jgi:hypothetical protein
VRAPRIRATIERRLLVNYRVDLDPLASILPPPFRPAPVQGVGMAGICLIRLSGIRPSFVPAVVGLTTENAAHRIAVEWDGPDGVARGVYIPRRDTSSRVVSILGGRAFPGWHHLADFAVDERDGRYRVELKSRDGEVSVTVSARRADAPMDGSVFASVEDASSFFRCAPVGYAATPAAGVFDGVELETCGWAIEPLIAEEVHSTFFDDPRRFPVGTALLDSAFLMERIRTTWTARPPLVSGARP